MTFALGVSLGLAAMLALARERLGAAAVLAALCAAASPVAGLLLALAGLTQSLASGQRHARSSLAAPLRCVVLLLSAMFGDGGAEPYPVDFVRGHAGRGRRRSCRVAAGRRALRIGALAYLAACVACLAVATRWEATWSATRCSSRVRCSSARSCRPAAARRPTAGMGEARRRRGARGRWSRWRSR